jgi:plasmid stability protein
VAKKKQQQQPTISAHDLDRIIVRLPEGMRERLTELAAANGRSMTAEVVAALDNHLKSESRINQLWDFFERHRENIELIPVVRAAVENLELYAERSGDDFQGGLRAWRWHKEREAHDAAQPPITPDQAEQIRALIHETGTNEAKLLAVFRAPRVEEIRNFKKAIFYLERAKENLRR